jgi:hypothetical protein
MSPSADHNWEVHLRLCIYCSKDLEEFSCFAIISHFLFFFVFDFVLSKMISATFLIIEQYLN